MPTAGAELIDEATYYGLLKLRNEILTMPVTERSAPTLLKAIEFLVNRAHGSVIQRIEAKHAHLDLNNSDMIAKTPEELQSAIDTLKSKLFPKHIPPTITSEPE